MSAVNWLFIIGLFVLCALFLTMGILICIITATTAGIVCGIISCVLGIGFGIGAGYLIKYTLNNKNNTETVNPV